MRALHAHSLDSITLQLKDGRLIHWGSDDQNAQKVRVIRVLLKQPASGYDVSVPAQPTTSR
jgi:cell division protein FtsQ